jgi:predicted transposase YbfD/YdcC
MTEPFKIPQTSSLFTSHFTTLKDPRRVKRGNYMYPLKEILFLTISAVISGFDSWNEIEIFGLNKLEWFRKYFPYENGIPSHDVINRLFANLNVKQFNVCFINWVNAIADLSEGRVVAIDGKTIRGAASNLRADKLHIVTAFCNKNNLSIGQLTVFDKSNEIIAIPELLELIAIKGCIVTIDAMGCQKKIADKIVDKKADYLLAVKDNQKELHEQIKKVFKLEKPVSFHSQEDFAHGRIEKRSCEVITNLTHLDCWEDWRELNAIVCITSQRIIKKTGHESQEQRYYITSLKNPGAKQIADAVRSHWGIENKLHWTLDVVMNEDNGLKRKDYSAENFNIIRKIALGMISNENQMKASKKAKMKTAALSDKYREKLLNI